jgi:hypothetical protein
MACLDALVRKREKTFSWCLKKGRELGLRDYKESEEKSKAKVNQTFRTRRDLKEGLGEKSKLKKEKD